MDVLTSEIPRRLAYRLLIGCIVPRPVAWVSSVGADGTRNLAPFSYFMGIGNDPPLLAVSVNARQKARKDTLRNVEETGEMVVHIANEDLLERMVLTSGEYGYEVDEFNLANLTAIPSQVVSVPRVQEAPIALECRVLQVMRLGHAPNMTGLIVGEVLAWHIDESVVTDGVPDMAKLRPVGRMIDDEYIVLRERRVVPRPRTERA